MTDPRGVGLHELVPFSEYVTWDACSSSALKWIDQRSSAYCLHRLHTPKTTAAMTVGTAGHHAILEPGLFTERYVERPVKDDGVTLVRANSKDYKAWLDTLPDRTTPLTPDMYAASLGMRRTALAHPEVQKLFGRALQREVSAVWLDKDTGLPCRLRADCFGNGIIADVKTTGAMDLQRLDQDSIERWLARNRHHLQAAFYLDGMKALGNGPMEFWWIIVRQDAPHEVAVVKASDELLRYGRERARRAKSTYAQCLESGEWPGGPVGAIVAEPPQWEVDAMFPEEHVELTQGGKKMEGF